MEPGEATVGSWPFQASRRSPFRRSKVGIRRLRSNGLRQRSWRPIPGNPSDVPDARSGTDGDKGDYEHRNYAPLVGNLSDVCIRKALPDDFIPELPSWRQRSVFIARHGSVDFLHYDLCAQALAKIAGLANPSARSTTRFCSNCGFPLRIPRNSSFPSRTWNRGILPIAW